MTQHVDVVRKFYESLTNLELVKLRHEAIRLDDKISKELIDNEFKRREKKLT